MGAGRGTALGLVRGQASSQSTPVTWWPCFLFMNGKTEAHVLGEGSHPESQSQGSVGVPADRHLPHPKHQHPGKF